MRRFVILSALALAAHVGAAPLSAEEFPVAERRQLAANYAACVVKTQAETAAKAVLGQWRNDEIISNRRLIDGKCLPRRRDGRLQLQLGGPLMLYALADALVDRDPALDVANLDRVAPLDHRPVDENWFAREAVKRKRADSLAELEKDRQMQTVDVAMSRFGECAVRQRPAEALRLLRTQPGTPEEKVAFAAVTPVLGNCLGEGTTIELSRDVVRGTMALNLYRLAKAPRSASAPGANQ